MTIELSVALQAFEGQANGLATLSSDAKVPNEQIRFGGLGDAVGPAAATPEVVYATNSAGQQATMPYTVAATPETLCFRDENGHVQVSPSTASTAAATYGQLESRLSAAQRTAINALTPVATADATDLPTAVALANANKAAVNAVIAALKAT